MFLAIDIGNSNIVIALYKENAWQHIYRYETKEPLTPEYYEKGLLDLLLEWGVQLGDIRLVGISSVVPSLNQKIEWAIQNTMSCPVVWISPETFFKLEMAIPKPYEIGSDLVANAYAAITFFRQNAIIVDFGTALTFTVVSLEKGILGVTIAPGLKTALGALYGNTAQLPLVPFEIPDSAIGQSTAHAIQAGIGIGYRGLVKEIIETMKLELLPESYWVIATGGLSDFIHSLGALVDKHERHLTLDGIRLIAEKVM